MKTPSDEENISNYDEKELVRHLFLMLNDKNEDINIYAIRALKHYHSPRIIEALTQIVENDPSSEKKVAAIYSLKNRKINVYIQKVLLNQLLSENEDVRNSVVDILKIQQEDVISKLYEIVREKPPSYALPQIIELLGEIGDKETLEFLNNSRLFKKNKYKSLITLAENKIKQRNLKLLFEDMKKKERK
ncbi:MAG: HEAT repeat domain-containing protein [Candidatus Heimdallarchaeaceae archaeon]